VTALELSDVRVDLGDRMVVSGVSLAVGDGEFLGLVGPNGAGKTTLVRAVNGVIEPDAGEVTVAGESVADLPAREHGRLVATVPQDTAVGFDLTVADLVEMGRTPYRSRCQFGPDEADREAVERALERTATTELRDRPLSELSGGERQRAYVARALTQDARVLVCDEPTASLDVNHQVSILGLLADLAADGRTVLAAIHDLDLAARFCDRLALLSDGEIAAVDSPETVLASDPLDEAFGARTTVTTDPVTGTPRVTTHQRPAAPDPRGSGDEETSGRTVHVVGGGRIGATCYDRLAAAGFAVSAGPLRAGDLALEAARSLGVDTVTGPPTGDLDDATVTAARRRAAEADAVVLADPVLGTAGHILAVATAGAHCVIVEDRPLHERNFAGDRARERYERLRSASTVVTLAHLPAAATDVVAMKPATTDD